MDSRILSLTIKSCYRVGEINKFKSSFQLINQDLSKYLFNFQKSKSRLYFNNISFRKSSTLCQSSNGIYNRNFKLVGNDYKIHLQRLPLISCSFSSKPNHDDNTDDKNLSQSKDTEVNSDETDPATKLSLFQRFKQMYKEYWYVLIPVHIVTSVMWYGSFYYALKSGVDLASLLEQIGVGETIMRPLRNTSAGYFALAYAMYKISTPARYAVTLGGTTLSINYLRSIGVIKPIPSKDRMKEIWKEKKGEIKEKREQAIENWKSKKSKF